MMCGAGGMPISEWARMKSLRLARLWVEGYRKRARTLYEVGWIVARAAVSPHVKDVPPNYPFDLKAMIGESEPEEEAPEETNFDDMKQALFERMKAKMGNKK